RRRDRLPHRARPVRPWRADLRRAALRQVVPTGTRLVRRRADLARRRHFDLGDRGRHHDRRLPAGAARCRGHAGRHRVRHLLRARGAGRGARRQLAASSRRPRLAARARAQGRHEGTLLPGRRQVARDGVVARRPDDRLGAQGARRVSLVEANRDSARLRLRQALLRAPLFSDLDSASMAAVERELTPLALPGGAPLFHQGEAADAVYLVTSGCLGVFRHDDDDAVEGGPALIAEITPGNIVGEMSLLSHGKRTRSVAALRDSEVWRLAQASFDNLTSHHPEVLPALMRNIAVRNAMGPVKRRRQPRTFALLPSGSGVASSRFAVQLERALARIGGEAQMLGSDSMNEDPEWFARCELDHPFVLYRADPALTPWTQLCLRQADCLVVLHNGDTNEPTRLPFEIEAAQPGAVFHRRRELVLLHEGHDPRPGSTAGQLAGGLYGQHHHVRLDMPSDFDRLARLITGHAVGIVMAGGGA